MPRPKKVDETVQRPVRLRRSVSAKVDCILFSEVEGRVPYGAWQNLIEQLLDDWLAKQAAAVGDTAQPNGEK